MFYFLRLACAFQLRICILLAWESLFLHEIIVRDAVETTCFLLQVLVVVFLACFRIVILVSSFSVPFPGCGVLDCFAFLVVSSYLSSFS